jgi:hypothetical protein
VVSARFLVDPDEMCSGIGREVGVAIPTVSEPGRPIDRLGHSSTDPPFRSFRRDRCDVRPAYAEKLAVNVLPPQQSLDDQNSFLESRCPLTQVCSHGLKLVATGSGAGLDDERPGGQSRQRGDLLGHEDRIPQRNEKEGADRAFSPFGQQATEHRHVLHVPGRTSRVMIAQGQRVEGGSVGGLRLAEHSKRSLTLPPWSVSGERGSNGYTDLHHYEDRPHTR